MRISADEFAQRRDALASTLEERSLDGCVLFETHYVTYYTGFSFIPTERPIAFVLTSDGRGGMLVPRLEVEHAQANTAVSETPGRVYRCSSVCARFAHLQLSRSNASSASLFTAIWSSTASAIWAGGCPVSALSDSPR